jgi:hypothetical protein
MSFRDENRSFTGKTRYYDREVTLHKAGAEGVWQTTTVSSTEAAKRCM